MPSALGTATATPEVPAQPRIIIPLIGRYFRILTSAKSGRRLAQLGLASFAGGALSFHKPTWRARLCPKMALVLDRDGTVFGLFLRL